MGGLHGQKEKGGLYNRAGGSVAHVLTARGSLNEEELWGIVSSGIALFLEVVG